MYRRLMMSIVFALTACGGSSGTSTSSGTPPASSATTASVAAATYAFMGKWKRHGGLPAFQDEYDHPLSGLNFSSGGKGYWLNDLLVATKGVPFAKHRITGAYSFEWKDVGNGKIRITQHANVNDYTPTVEGNELTLVRSDPMAKIIFVFDRVK